MVAGGKAAESVWDVADAAPTAESPWLDASPEASIDAPPRQIVPIVAGAALLLLAAAWLALVGYVATTSIRPRGDRLLDLFALAPAAAAPLALIGVAWLLVQRTSRREARRFARTAAAMRGEAARLEAVLARIGGTIDENRRLLADQAGQLIAIGEEAAARLGAVRGTMAEEGAALSRHSVLLARTAAGARGEMDALLADLPRADAQSRELATRLHEAGAGALSHAAALEAQVAALALRGQEADGAAGGAAQRLAAELARIEAHGGEVARGIEQVAGTLGGVVDGALDRAAAALGEVRGGLDAQGAATRATIDAARAAFGEAANEAAAAVGERLDQVAARLEAMGRQLGEQDARAAGLVRRLETGIGDVDAQFAALEEQAQARTATIGEAVGGLRGQTERAILALGDGVAATDRLGERAGALRGAIDAIGREIDSLPPSLDAVDQAAKRSRATVAAAGPETARLEAAARAAQDRLMRVHASFAEQQATVDRLAENVAARTAGIEAHARALEDIEGRFARFGDAGAERTADLAEAIVALSGHAQAIATTFGGSVGDAEALARRLADIVGAVGEVRGALDETLPAALDDVTAGAERARAAVARARPEAEAVEAAVDRAVERIEQVDRAAAAQRAELLATGDAAEATVARLAESLDRLRDGIAHAGSEAGDVAEGAAPRLVEAMLRVREAANAASANARDALAEVIPAAAASLGAASREAVEQAVAGQVAAQMREIGDASERAVAAAHAASDRLMRQMLTIADTTAAVEARIAEAHGEIEAHDEESFSRRVALLIESLNSTAIDVARLFSADVADVAWAAYLRGDRGVFTRRAVRLLDSGEAREIARHYEEQPVFREQVNRYIHDFEAMLRRVLANRDGAPLGVTLLSSDMGKLYVALAQAIERLRT